MICKNCNIEIKGNYCPKCGKKVNWFTKIFSSQETTQEQETMYSIVNSLTKETSITKRDVDEYTRNVPVADVKTYLKEEYDRAFDREELIRTLEKEIQGYKIIQNKYEALLIVQENKEKRYKQQEEQLCEYKKLINKKDEEIKNVKAKQAEIMVNCKKEVQEARDTYKQLEKENKTIKRDTIKQFRETLTNVIMNYKGQISKGKIMAIINGADIENIGGKK